MTRFRAVALCTAVGFAVMGVLAACSSRPDENGSAIRSEHVAAASAALSDPDAAPPAPAPATIVPGDAGPPQPPPTTLLDAPDSEYRTIPGGRRVHQSCIQTLRIPSGSNVDATTGTTYLPDGDVIPSLGPCQYVDHTSQLRGPQQQPTPGGLPWEMWSESLPNGYANGNYAGPPAVVCGSSGPPLWLNEDCWPWINQTYGVVHVPIDPPFVTSTQYVYIWNGSSAFNGSALLQPVLTYTGKGTDCGDPGGTWSVPFWYIDPNGVSHEYCGLSGIAPGSYVRLNTYIFDNNCDLSTGDNCDWAMHAWINGGPSYYQYFTASTPPGITPPDSGSPAPGAVPHQVWYERAVLETYAYSGQSLSAYCDQLPGYPGPIGSVEWYNTQMYQPLTSPTDYHQTGPSQYSDGTALPAGSQDCAYSFNNTTESTSYVQMYWNVQ